MQRPFYVSKDLVDGCHNCNHQAKVNDKCPHRDACGDERIHHTPTPFRALENHIYDMPRLQYGDRGGKEFDNQKVVAWMAGLVELFEGLRNSR